jgi:hypothetical protein
MIQKKTPSTHGWRTFSCLQCPPYRTTAFKCLVSLGAQASGLRITSFSSSLTYFAHVVSIWYYNMHLAGKRKHDMYIYSLIVGEGDRVNTIPGLQATPTRPFENPVGKLSGARSCCAAGLTGYSDPLQHYRGIPRLWVLSVCARILRCV